jgi:pimeloyl-ACP methyl ester carboxylesterase
MRNESVVLVHGLWMNGWDMSLLSTRIQDHGYNITQFSYNSLSRTPRENAAKLQEKIHNIDTPVIHFVCHSLGGLIVRFLFSDYPEQKPGRVVTLGSPHQSSYAAHRLSRLPFGSLMLGKSIENGLLGNPPKWNGSHELGSIAGDLRFGLGMLISNIPLPNDGTVSIDETKMATMKDHVIVHASHFGLLLSNRAARLCVEFIKNGTFKSI